MDFRRQEGRKAAQKGEIRSKQTSEGKQKLMKQDVTTDGSLHTSKHGTLAGPLQIPHSNPLPSSPPHGETKDGIIPRSLCCSHGTVNHHGGF